MARVNRKERVSGVEAAIQAIPREEDVPFAVLADFGALSPRLQSMLSYWQAKAGCEALPARADIVAAEIPRLLPYMAIVDILREPFDFRYRLVGTHLTEMMGAERTGLRMREIFPPPAAAATGQLIARLVSHRQPIACAGNMPWLNANYREFQALILPLAADGREVNMALMVMNFTR